MATLRVLSLSTLFPDASRPQFGIFVERSLAALARQPGIDLTVVAPLGLPPFPLDRLPAYSARREIARAEDWHGLTVLRPRWRLWPGIGARRNGAAVARTILAAIAGLPRFDVIDAQFLHPEAVAAQRLGSALGIPWSVKARGSDVSFWLRRADTGPAIRDAVRAAAGVLAVSAALRAEMAALGLSDAPVTVHPTGVDATAFRPGDRAAARARFGFGDAPLIVSVGTLNANKGQHLVIAAMRALPDLHYAVAGTGPDAERLRHLATEAGVAGRVRWLGSVAHDDLPALFNAADIAVQPSASEGLANVWVEAMACGTPVIAADIPPAHEAIEPPHGGRIVPRDADAIAGAVRALLADPPNRAALAAATHRRFSWDRHAADHAAHLRAIVGQL